MSKTLNIDAYKADGSIFSKHGKGELEHISNLGFSFSSEDDFDIQAEPIIITTIKEIDTKPIMAKIVGKIRRPTGIFYLCQI